MIEKLEFSRRKSLNEWAICQYCYRQITYKSACFKLFERAIDAKDSN